MRIDVVNQAGAASTGSIIIAHLEGYGRCLTGIFDGSHDKNGKYSVKAAVSP